MTDKSASARVFVSYSRRDTEAARALVDDLNAAGFEAFLDVHDIAPGEPWKERLGELVAAAEKVVFLISPDSVASAICAWEVDAAERQAKSILPVVLRETDDAAIPGRLARLNFIFMRTPEERTAQFESLMSALSTDLDWEREKTEINELAQEWAAGGRRDRTLRFPEEKIAGWERWRDRHPETALPPTELQLSFITEARRVATRRQRRIVVASVTAAGFAIVLAIVAWTQRELAVANEQRAERERNAALTSQSQFLADIAEQDLAAGQATTAMLVALEGMPDPETADRPLVREADIALSRAMGQVRLAHVFPGAAAMSPTWNSAVVGVRSGEGASLVAPETGKVLTVLGPTEAAEYAPDGRHLLTREPSAGQGAVARLRDATTGAVRAEFSAIGYHGFSPAGRYVLSGRDVWRIAEPGSPMTAPAYTRRQDGYVAFGPQDATIVETGIREGQAWFEIRRAADYGLIREGRGNFAFDEAHSRLALQTGDWTLEVADVTTGETLAALDATADRRGIAGFNSLVFAPEESVLQIGHMSNPTLLWHYRDDRVAPAPGGYSIYCPPDREPEPGNFDAQCETALSPDGRLQARIEADAVALRTLPDDMLVARLEGHAAPVARLVFSPDGTLLLTLTRAETHIPYDTEARLWSTRTGALVATLDHAGMESEGGFSPDGSHIWTGDGETARVWRTTPGGVLASLRAGAPADRMVVDPAGRWAARLGATGEVELVDLATGARRVCEGPAPLPLRAAAFAPQAGPLVALAEDGTVASWTTDCDRTVSEAAAGGQGAQLAISGDGTLLVVGGARGLVVLSLPGLEPVARVPREAAGIADPDHDTSLAISHAGDRIAAVFRPRGEGDDMSSTELRIFSASDGAQIGPSHDASGAVFSPAGDRLVLLGKDSGIIDAATGDRIATLPVRLEPFDQVRFDPTGQRIVVLSDAERAALVFEVATGARIPPPGEPAFYPFGFGPVDFTADGALFLVPKSGQATSQNGFDVYETGSAEVLHEATLGDGNAAPGSVVFGPGDRTIISALEDGILIQDGATYALVSHLTVSAATVVSARASADGSRIVAELSSNGMTVDQVAALPFFETPEARVRAARLQAPRCLTPQERRAIFVSEAPPRWCITGAGREADPDPARWRPLHPYRGADWRDWQIARDRGRAPPMPQ